MEDGEAEGGDDGGPGLAFGAPDLARDVHLDVEDCSEELLRQQSYYAIQNQLGHPKPPTKGLCSSLVLYGVRIVGFHARK